MTPKIETAFALIRKICAELSKRLIHELQHVQREGWVSIKPGHGDEGVGSLRELVATLQGPALSPFVDGVFKLRICVPEDYPESPPTLQFVTPIWHPNITREGVVDKHVVEPLRAWSRTRDLSEALSETYQLLRFPDFAHTPANVEAADRAAFQATAREWTLKYAKEE
eukprot:tig00021350_g20634.t1